jgi:phage protein D
MDSSLENFNPQLNSGAQVQTVKVYGWDPKKKQKIIGVYTAEASQLGSELGAGSFNDQPVLNINNVPVRTKEEADLVAKSIGVERNMNYVTGSGTTKGNAKIKVGKIVEIETDDDRFNGKSYVAGVRHTFSHTATGLGGGTGMGGFKTTVKFQRDATKK